MKQFIVVDRKQLISYWDHWYITPPVEFKNTTVEKILEYLECFAEVHGIIWVSPVYKRNLSQKVDYL